MEKLLGAPIQGTKKCERVTAAAEDQDSLTRPKTRWKRGLAKRPTWSAPARRVQLLCISHRGGRDSATYLDTCQQQIFHAAFRLVGGVGRRSRGTPELRRNINNYLFRAEEWEELANLFFAWLPAVFGDLERLGVLHASRLRAIAFFERGAPVGQHI